MAKKKTNKTTQKSNLSNSNRSNILWAIGFGLLAFLLYANTLGSGYVLDDYSVIKDNYVTKQGFEGIATHWKEHYRFGFWNSQASLYRPLTLTFFATIWGISPDNTFLYHLVNVLFFAFTAGLLFMLLRRLLPQTTVLFAIAVTALFVVHPIHVEIVANIKSLDEILALFFGLKAIYMLLNYVDSRRIFWLISSALVYLLALFSKESAITFVAIFPLILYFFSKESLAKIAQMCAIYLLPAGLFLFIRYQIVGAFGVGDNISFLDNAIMGAKTTLEHWGMVFFFLGKYLFNLILPYQLSSDFGFNQIPVLSMIHWKPLVALLLYVAMGVFALWKIKDKNIAAFGILFFLITFAPVSNFIIMIGTSYGDRIVYIPSLGFIIFIVYLIFKAFKVDFSYSKNSLGSQFQANILPCALIGLFVVAYSAKTISRNSDWKSSFSLYDADVKVSPNSAKLRYHYSLELSQKGLDATDENVKRKWFDRAKEQLEQAVSIYPQYHDSYAQLGLYYYRIKDNNKALQMYEEAIKHKPNSPKAYSNMGIIYFGRNDIANAQRVYEKAVQLDPRFVDARRNLGSVYARKGEFVKAVEQFSEAIKYAPDDVTINFYLGSALRDSGNLAGGQPYLDKACRLDSNFCKKK